MQAIDASLEILDLKCFLDAYTVVVKKVVVLAEPIMPSPEQSSGPLESVWRDSA